MSLNPIKIKGNWDEGYVLDIHTIKSFPVGTYPNGRTIFETTRTELGKLLFELKNRNKIENVSKILNLIAPFLDKWIILKQIDFVISVPPSDKTRDFQPSEEIAKAIADYLGKDFAADVLKKTTSTQSKNMDKSNKNLEGSIIAKLKAKQPHTILLVDDLYGSGSTFEECVSVLKQDPLIKNIYVLAMTKKRT